MKKLFALLLALVMMLSLVACVQSEPEGTKGSEATKPSGNTMPSVDTIPSSDPEEDISKRYGGTFYIKFSVGDTYDPMRTSGWKSYTWSQNVYENIIYRDAEGNLAPGVCDFELSEDALTLKLWVRDGVKFHNGDLVDIYDVKASFERSCANISRMKNHVVPYLVSAEITEGKYLTIKFNAYDPTTLYYLSAPQVWTVVLPKEVCEKYGNDQIINVEDAIGTGPYYVDKSSDPGVKMVLNRFEDHCKAEPGRTGMAAPKMAYFDTIVVETYDDLQVALMEMILGEKTMQMSYKAELDEMYKQVPGLKLYPESAQGLYYLAFNCKNPNVACYDANIRKAIAAAIDYDEIMLYYNSGLEYGKDVSPMVVGSPYYCEKYANAEYHGAANLDLVKKYLTAANYNGEEIIFLCDQGSNIASILSARFTAAGLNVKFEYMDGSALSSFILEPETNKFDFTLQTSAQGDYIPATIASNVLDNFYDGVDDHLKTNATLVVGSDASIADWKLADAKLAEDCPTVIFGTNAVFYAFSHNVIWDCAGPSRYFYNCYIDPSTK